jgi:hypothetical protein
MANPVEATVRFADTEDAAAQAIMRMQDGETILVVSGHGLDATRVSRFADGWEVTALVAVTVTSPDGRVNIPLAELTDGIVIKLHEPE